jgi:hypothetical protein
LAYQSTLIGGAKGNRHSAAIREVRRIRASTAFAADAENGLAATKPANRMYRITRAALMPRLPTMMVK